MKIHLPSIQTVYINLPSDQDKNLSMQTLLQDFTNVTRIDGVVHDKPVVGIAMAHLNALKTYPKPPFLVLEDDCIEYDMVFDFEIPDHADIVFLGLWSFMIDYERGQHASRIKYIMGAHAILYVSEHAVQMIANVYDDAIANSYPNDHALGNILPKLNAYALNKPIFAQTSKLFETWFAIE